MKMVDLSTPVDLDDPFTMMLAWPETMFAVTPDEVMRATLDLPDVPAGDPALVPAQHVATAAATKRFLEGSGVTGRWIVRVYVFLRRPTAHELGITCSWDRVVSQVL